MPDEAGVEIYKRFYPWPARFRIGDPVLVNQVTAMTWPDFCIALEEQERSFDQAQEEGVEPPEPDQVVLAGLIAVAFWQGNSQMSREKARKTIERVPLDEIEIIGEEEDDADPPALGEGGSPPSTPSRPSDASAEADPPTEAPADSI